MKTTPAVSRRIAAAIAKRNALWESATPAERRVLVAKDVLSQLRKGKFIATNGRYARLDVPVYSPDEALDVRECIMDSRVKCQCCGVGSLMLSTILFRDNVKAEASCGYISLASPNGGSGGDNLSFGTYDGGLTVGVFGKGQLDLIEIAFEGWDQDEAEEKVSKSMAYVDNPALAAKARAFGQGFDTASTRLRAIMKNIIANDGTFKP